MTKELKVVPWTYRDGSVHLEIRLVHFASEGATSDAEVVTHLDAPGRTFESACGIPYWGVAHGTGLGKSGQIDCERCRTLLASATFSWPVPEGQVV